MCSGPRLTWTKDRALIHLENAVTFGFKPTEKSSDSLRPVSCRGTDFSSCRFHYYLNENSSEWNGVLTAFLPKIPCRRFIGLPPVTARTQISCMNRAVSGPARHPVGKRDFQIQCKRGRNYARLGRGAGSGNHGVNGWQVSRSGVLQYFNTFQKGNVPERSLQCFFCIMAPRFGLAL